MFAGFVYLFSFKNTVCEAQQKIWCDADFSQFRISWLPPVKGKGNENKGGKRPDEHPMRLGDITEVENLKGELLAATSFVACVAVTNKDGRVWRMGFSDLSLASAIATGLRSKADPVAQSKYVQGLISEST